MRKIDMMSDSAAAYVAFGKRQCIERAEKFNAMEEQAINEEARKKAYVPVAEAAIRESQMYNKFASYSSDLKAHLLKDVILEMFTNSLLLDDEFVHEHSANFDIVIGKYITENGGFKLIENAVNRTGSELLKRMKTVCETTASKVAERKMKESIEYNDPSVLNFDMTSEEEKEFKNGKDTLNPDEISDLVKDKVLTVVKDEKNRQAKEDEIKEEIENELKDDESVTDVNSAKEAVDRILANNMKLEETTLFNALLRNSCNEYLIEGVASNVSDFNTESDSDDMSYSAPFSASIEDELKDDLDEDAASKEACGSNKTTMETAFADAIAQYTLMELMYTLKIEDYTYENIRKVSNKLIQPIRK
jgi:hypothetical protein